MSTGSDRITEVLKTAKTIAVVGLTDSPLASELRRLALHAFAGIPHHSR